MRGVTAMKRSRLLTAAAAAGLAAGTFGLAAAAIRLRPCTGPSRQDELCRRELVFRASLVYRLSV